MEPILIQGVLMKLVLYNEDSDSTLPKYMFCTSSVFKFGEEAWR